MKKVWDEERQEFVYDSEEALAFELDMESFHENPHDFYLYGSGIDIDEEIPVYEEVMLSFLAGTSESSLHPTTRYNMWVEDQKKDGYEYISETLDREEQDDGSVLYFWTVWFEKKL
jgi:hypothetical protein